MKTMTLQNTVAAEIEISYHNQIKAQDMKSITCSRDACDVLRSVWGDRMQYVEEFFILLLNKANRVLGFCKIGQGGSSGCVVEVKVIFQAALLSHASSLILAHNHPSGNLKPSEADERLTGKIKEAGKLLDLSVLDHLIMTQECYFSFADEGKI